MLRSPILAAILLAALASPSMGQGVFGIPAPPQNPITPAKARLGKILFWEEQLSSDNTVACGTCHRSEVGGVDPRVAGGSARRHPGADGIQMTADDVFGSAGIVRADAANDYKPDPVFGLETQVTKRKAPGMIGVSFHFELFWDGRASTVFTDPVSGSVAIPFGGALESLSLEPLLSETEMGREGRTLQDVVAKLQAITPMKLATNLTPDIVATLATNQDYPALFNAAFGTSQITPLRIAFALATYLRTLIPDQTPFDQFFQGNFGAMTPNQQAGFFNVFAGFGRCVICHTPPFLSDDSFHNNGLRPPAQDPGRQAVTGLAMDAGRFKVPLLRNVGLRQRFMHTGEFTTLTQVINFYNQGGNPVPNKDPAMTPLFLTPAEKAQLEDFLANALTDPRVAQALPPFDRPTLHSESQAPNPVAFGTGSPGGSGATPAFIDPAPLFTNDPAFKIGMKAAEGGGVALLAIGLDQATPGLAFSGVPVLVDPTNLALIQVLPVSGTGPAGGHATWHLPIPDAPGLRGLDVYVQWLTTDSGATPGIAATDGRHYTIF